VALGLPDKYRALEPHPRAHASDRTKRVGHALKRCRATAARANGGRGRPPRPQRAPAIQAALEAMNVRTLERLEARERQGLWRTHLQ
jgi:hypothetical protein